MYYFAILLQDYYTVSLCKLEGNMQKTAMNIHLYIIIRPTLSLHKKSWNGICF